MRLSIALCVTFLFAYPAVAADTSEKLFNAIRSNDLNAVKALLPGEKAANAKDNRETTPLMYASAFGSVEALKLLIDAGADVNARNAFGATALMWAVNDIGKVRLLLAKGAEVNSKSKMGRSALLMAASDDAGLPVVRMLLDKGAEVDARDAMQTTALIQAANRDIALLLLAKGADVNAKDGGGFTPLLGAAAAGDIQWTKLLLAKGAAVNAVSEPSFGPPVKNGKIALGLFTPLLLAVAYGSPELVKILIDAGADVNARDVRGMTPLILAIGSDHNDPGVVKVLLDKGGDPKIKSKDGEDAVVWAKRAGSAEVLALFGIQETARGTAKVSAVTAGYEKPDVSNAVQKGIGLLQKTSSKFLMEGGCATCHAHNMTAMAVSVARAKGVHIDETAAGEQLKATKFGWATFEQPMLQRMDPPGAAEMTSYAAVAMGLERAAPERVTDAMVFNLAAEQLVTGQWFRGGIARPPMEDGPFSPTAMAIRSIQLYGMPSRKREFDERTARAKAWLMNAQPRTTEDRNMQLLGLHWAGSDPAVLRPLAAKLVQMQRPDGGWAQTRDLASDAYATGQTLYTMSVAGIPATDPAYRRGVAYLLNNQFADGSWHVVSRAPKFQPYFQSGFPHDHDQWISSSATGWAIMGLTAVLESPKIAALQ